MPELPEVETTLRGITPHIINKTITDVVVRNHHFRWPIDENISDYLINHRVHDSSRRGKYMLLHLTQGTIIIHLGMSGRLCVLHEEKAAKKHDHVDLIFDQKTILRFTDPRRFGAFLWTGEDPQAHFLLRHLAREPLDQEFNGEYLFSRAQGKKIPIKTFIMDQKIVVGVGNIYANEALFLSSIDPRRSAGSISLSCYQTLAENIKIILRIAIQQGGTTLRDFLNTDGKPGYFSQSLNVYGRENLPCIRCNGNLLAVRMNGRNTTFCGSCQK